MQLRNTPDRYGLVSKLFHWTVFVLLVAQFATAWLAPGHDHGAHGHDHSPSHGHHHAHDAAAHFWHKSIGLLVFIIVLARLTWRLTTPLPDWAEALSRGQRRFTRLLERVLYGLMLALPLAGIAMVWSRGESLEFFGLFKIASPMAANHGLGDVLFLTHKFLGWTILAAIALHIGFVLWHTFSRQSRLAFRVLGGG